MTNYEETVKARLTAAFQAACTARESLQAANNDLDWCRKNAHETSSEGASAAIEGVKLSRALRDKAHEEWQLSISEAQHAVNQAAYCADSVLRHMALDVAGTFDLKRVTPLRHHF